MRRIRRRNLSVLVAIATLLGSGPVFADRSPQDWLSAMAAAVQSTSYEGTVVRTRDGSAEALKVVHTVTDGVVYERVTAQEGSGLEIIRSGNEVHRILPDRQSVLVETWDDQPTLFSTLPTSNIRFGNEYDVAVDRTERVAGRAAVVVAIRPHDGYRYGHKIWLDAETSFPLQTQLIDAGSVIEQVKFVDITLNQEIHPSLLATAYETELFTWFQQSSPHHSTDVVTSWTIEELPAGFSTVSTHEETMAGTDEAVTHILLSDGLANVSVFIAPSSDHPVAGAARMGGSNSYCAKHDDYEITAIGEVPAMTVKQIASSMRQR